METQQLSTHLSLLIGAGNVGVLRDGTRALVIDPGDPGVGAALAGVTVDTVLLTHYHRDNMVGLGSPALADARLMVPRAEAYLFSDAEAYWADPASRWHLYNYRPFFLVPTASRPVAGTLADDDSFTWGPARITVLATPGHTDGSLSYLIEVDGQRVLFTGDLLSAPGQVWDCYSLQQGGTYGATTIWDYHAYLGARAALFASLRRAAEVCPTTLVPTHGLVMPDPAAAVTTTIAAIETAFRAYAATSALQHYFPAVMDGVPATVRATTAPPPAWLRHHGTTWVLCSASGAALVMDCGQPNVIDQLRDWQSTGDITTVEGIWISHYHDDHVDAVPAFQAAFDCPLYADAAVAAVIAEPLAWRLPCISPSVCRVDHILPHGTRWQWHEFTLTAYHCPGQTYYHGALLIEGRGQRIMNIGDSFAPTGLDDYCPLNRNPLGAGEGFDACLALLEEVQPNALFNPHVDDLFTFTPAQIAQLRDALARRVATLATLTPWPAPDYAFDPYWVRCHPYQQQAVAGKAVEIAVVVTNDTDVPQPVACQFTGEGMLATAIIPPHAEASLPLTVPSLPPGRQVLSVDLTFAGRLLPACAETIIDVCSEAGD